MKYYKKDEEFMKQRRLFIRNVGLTLAAFGFAPDVRVDLMRGLLVKAKFNTAYGFEIGNERAKTAIEIVYRAGANLRKYISPAAAAMAGRPPNAHVWAGSLEAGTPVDIQNAVPMQSPTTGNFLAAGEVFDKLKDVPLAFFEWNRGNVGHCNNHGARNGVNNANNAAANGYPCPALLHTATTPRNAILPNCIVWNLNGSGVFNEVGQARLSGAGYQAPTVALVNNGNSTNNTAAQFVSLFTAGIRLDGFNQAQRVAVADAINDFGSYGLNQRSIANAPQVLGSTQSVSSLISTNLGEQLALTQQEIQDWDANSVNMLIGGGTGTLLNLGLAVASIYKAARLGLAQDFILQVNEEDRHSEQEGALQNGAGWQIVHRNQAVNFARIMNKLYNTAKNDPSPYGTGKTMWDEMMGHITAEWNRTPLAVGATDDGNGGSILFGGHVNSGTYFNHTTAFDNTGYASDPTAGGQIQFNNMFRPTSAQAWRMIARGFVGNEIAQKFHSPDQLGPGGLLYSYALKQNG